MRRPPPDGTSEHKRRASPAQAMTAPRAADARSMRAPQAGDNRSRCSDRQTAMRPPPGTTPAHRRLASGPHASIADCVTPAGHPAKASPPARAGAAARSAPARRTAAAVDFARRYIVFTFRAGQSIFRRSGNRFVEENAKKQRTRALSDCAGTQSALDGGGPARVRRAVRRRRRDQLRVKERERVAVRPLGPR